MGAGASSHKCRRSSSMTKNRVAARRSLCEAQRAGQQKLPKMQDPLQDALVSVLSSRPLTDGASSRSTTTGTASSSVDASITSALFHSERFLSADSAELPGSLPLAD
mmetsp:Transcript_11967/g.28022  ORF Transcript_11967/g.28022 Transcript_11967/m.28022 type:complete len:107 (+) Transcript_11967:105-425(+)